jgi:16S rRNA (cytosine1402-N4)-methyltransferase
MHKPVLLNEVIDSFSHLKEHKKLNYFDGTFGRGGHYTAIKNNYHLESATATDQDLEALKYAQNHFPEVQIHHQNFYDFAVQNQTQKFDMVLIDLGVSSPQLDQSERGFSFLRDGPLDMRMDRHETLTAAEIVNEYEEEMLFKVFQDFGEVENPYKVVKAILKDRLEKPFTSTLQLAQMIERVDGWKKKGFHPATQYFMGLRLVVNKELEVTEKAIPLFIDQLKDQGRISVITFHSLEDRIVKNIFKENQSGFVINKKVIVPTEEECKNNPRARSAKLRIFQKGKPPEKEDKFAKRRAQRMRTEC